MRNSIITESRMAVNKCKNSFPQFRFGQVKSYQSFKVRVQFITYNKLMRKHMNYNSHMISTNEGWDLYNNSGFSITDPRGNYFICISIRITFSCQDMDTSTGPISASLFLFLIRVHFGHIVTC